jgi:predicted PurR-regulated permease PerM
VLLLMMFTGALALIPFVGATAVWLPASLWLYFVDQRATAAVLLAIYGIAVVSSVDNLIKPLVLHGKSRLHPLLALLSVLGGVNALGPSGILVGPMIVAFLQTSLNILHRELLQFDLERRRRGDQAPAGS